MISISHIARTLGVVRQTIYSEIERGNSKGNYDPYFAQAQYEKRQRNKRRRSILLDKGLAEYISKSILINHLSPEKIVERLSRDPHGSPTVPRAVMTIYHAIDNGLIPGVTRESLLQRTVVVSKDGQVWIPSWAREKLGIKGGDILQFEITEDGGILYRKVKEPIG